MKVNAFEIDIHQSLKLLFFHLFSWIGTGNTGSIYRDAKRPLYRFGIGNGMVQ